MLIQNDGFSVHRWMKSNAAQSNACPTCKSLLSNDKIIPIYVRGREANDPRLEEQNGAIPNRPAGQRTEINQEQGWWSAFTGLFNPPNAGQNNNANIGNNIQFNAGFGFGIFPGFGLSFVSIFLLSH